ncbi:MAG: hypothetical protein P1U46_00705 [Patescibacteria group bacterium]|nr:hypothetical protein [Patescibacteria group bacterium]
MESTCKDCLQPNTDFSLINKYSSSEIFFDINKNNKNFYCIADAKEK